MVRKCKRIYLHSLLCSRSDVWASTRRTSTYSLFLEYKPLMLKKHYSQCHTTFLKLFSCRTNI
jgi:hypothetical protein